MATTPLGVYFPTGTDDATDPRAAYQSLAESVGKPLTFATEAAANTWLTNNPTYAKPGLIIHVTGKGAYINGE